MSPARAVSYFLLGIFAAQFAYYFVNLPENLAAHYNAFGEPDVWTAKNSFAIIEVVILSAILGTCLILPLLLDQLPASWPYLPNKNFWLAKDRRSETSVIIGKFLNWLAVPALGLLIGINQLIFKANILGQNLALTELFIILFLFFAAWIIWLRSYAKHFKKI